MKKYFEIQLTTTKAGNCVLCCEDNDTLVLNKDGKKAAPVFKNKEMELYPSRVGNFIVVKKEDDFFIGQITKIVREVSEKYKNKVRIQEVPYTEISYKAIVYYLNMYREGKWVRPLIHRIEEEAEKFVNK